MCNRRGQLSTKLQLQQSKTNTQKYRTPQHKIIHHVLNSVDQIQRELLYHELIPNYPYFVCHYERLFDEESVDSSFSTKKR